MATINISAARNPATGKIQGSYDPTLMVQGGSLSDIRWMATGGLTDGGSLFINTSALSFTTPESLNYLGHGTGWMYSNSVGTQLQTHSTTTALGSKTWEYEYNATPNREIVVDGGIRHLKAKIWASTGDFFDAAGMLNYDVGRATTVGDRLIQYSRGKCTVGAGNTNDDSFQMKSQRIGAYKNLDTNVNNSAYLKNYGSGCTLDIYNDVSGSSENYYTRGINKKGQPYTELWQWKQNTPNVADGSHIITSCRADLFSGLVIRKVMAKADHIGNANPERPRWIKWQDYLGNRGKNGTETLQTDVEWLCTDFYAQLNGTLFVIANSATLSSATQICPLVPTAFTSSTSWGLRLWRGGITTGYDTCYLHMLDADMNSVVAKNLQSGAA